MDLRNKATPLAKSARNLRQYREELGVMLRKRRRRLGLTQEDVAREVGVSAAYISQVETGKSMASLPTFVDICKKLKWPASHALRDTDNEIQKAFEYIVDAIGREGILWAAELDEDLLRIGADAARIAVHAALLSDPSRSPRGKVAPARSFIRWAKQRSTPLPVKKSRRKPLMMPRDT